MAFNYYDGWSESELLDERKLVQKQLSIGRTTEVRLAGEFTKNADHNSAPLELTLSRIAAALYLLYASGAIKTEYPNPDGPRVTAQSHY